MLSRPTTRRVPAAAARRTQPVSCSSASRATTASTPRFGPEACVGQWGGLDENSLPLWAHGGCGTGYSGITCGSCADDYRRFKTGCEQCPSAPIFQFAFSAGGFALVCLLIIRRSNAALAAPSIAQSLRSGATGTELLITSVRTLLSFVTVQSLIGEIDNAWPGIHGTMFWAYGVTAEISQLIEFMRCVPSINPFRLFTDPDLPFVLLKAIMTIWMPVLHIAPEKALSHSLRLANNTQVRKERESTR